ncbi:MAG: type VI secretion system tube protein Hcp [Acidimicrobiales bacterium]|nr:type VI secretion system tube protein Hcp [Hyphomonadaceae bacterium]RZV40656.1 MAG: type VI secretion system tube protein Hcp [Acidimicrobiales bacterium]
MLKTLLISTAIFAISTPASAAIFVKIPGVPGDVQAQTSKGSHSATGFSFAMSQPSGSATGQSRRRGSVNLDDLTFTKAVTAASPRLAEAAAKGQVFPTITIENTRQGKVVYSIKLENVRINGLQQESNGEWPVEYVTLSYSKITWTYAGAGGKTEASWDASTGR